MAGGQQFSRRVLLPPQGKPEEAELKSPRYHGKLLPVPGVGPIVLLFGVLFSQQIREDLVRAATSLYQMNLDLNKMARRARCCRETAIFTQAKRSELRTSNRFYKTWANVTER